MELACENCSFLVVSLNRKCAQKIKKHCNDINDILQFAVSAFCNSFFNTDVSLLPDIGEKGKCSFLLKVCCDAVAVQKFAQQLRVFLNEALYEYLLQCAVPEHCLRKLKVFVM